MDRCCDKLLPLTDTERTQGLREEEEVRKASWALKAAAQPLSLGAALPTVGRSTTGKGKSALEFQFPLKNHRTPVGPAGRRKQGPCAQTLTQGSEAQEAEATGGVKSCRPFSLHLCLLSNWEAKSKLLLLQEQPVGGADESWALGLSAAHPHQAPGCHAARPQAVSPRSCGMPILNSQSFFLSQVTARA